MTAVASVELDQRIIDVTTTIEERIASVLLGKPVQVRVATAALLSGEHLLLDDLPGVGKTTLASALARVLDGTFGRVQGTPDLLPSDLTGMSIYNQALDEWVFRPGALMANVVLVDELNRITPRTQSSLLEAMAEGHITVEGVTHPVPDPFVVVATMNPAGSAGTFPLTVGQLDRFGATIGLGSVDRDTERRLLRGQGGAPAIDCLQPVVPADLLPRLQAVVANVHLSNGLVDYVLDICDALRPHGHLSTRAARSMVALAQALAVLDGRGFVVPDDLKTMAIPCLAHRLTAEGERMDTHHDVVRAVLERLPVPDLPSP